MTLRPMKNIDVEIGKWICRKESTGNWAGIVPHQWVKITKIIGKKEDYCTFRTSNMAEYKSTGSTYYGCWEIVDMDNMWE